VVKGVDTQTFAAIVLSWSGTARRQERRERVKVDVQKRYSELHVLRIAQVGKNMCGLSYQGSMLSEQASEDYFFHSSI
jgi:hypothetical protein